ncbi:peptidylprolyl isomerase [Candidatus Woesearchaeota archaeon]|nr:peptidylprolyl isomerase [Candidatus Woesearchaeota archaeon]
MTEKTEKKKAADTGKKASTGKGAAKDTVKDGDVCCVHYTGKLESGEVFDSSKGREPLEFVVGSGQLIKGFDTAVVGMKKGDKKTVLLNPAEAYGDRDDRRVQQVQRSMLPKEPEPQPGMMLTISTPTGQMFPAKIDKVEKDVVTIDFNHPLAGKKLNFEIEVVDIKEDKGKPAGKGHDEGCGCCGH